MKKLFKNILVAGAFALATMLASCATINPSTSLSEQEESSVQETTQSSSEQEAILDTKYYTFTGYYTHDGVAMYSISFYMPSTFSCNVYNVKADGTMSKTLSAKYCNPKIVVDREIADNTDVIIKVTFDGNSYIAQLKTPTLEDISNF